MTWSERANFASLCAWAVGTAYMAVSALMFFGQDYRSFYAAARVFNAGGDPYDFRQVSQVLLEVTGRMGNYAYYSPPWFLVPFLPLALLPYLAGRAVWLLLNVGFWIAGLAATASMLEMNLSPRMRWLLYLAATVLFAWITWRYEQTGVLILLLLALFCRGIQRGQPAVSGFTLALMLSKPTVTLVMFTVLLLWLWQNRSFDVLRFLLIGMFGLFFVSLPLVGTWFVHLRDPKFTQGLSLVFDGPDIIDGTRINTTLRDWLQSMGANQEITALIGAAAIVVAVALLSIVLLQRSRLDLVVSVATVATFWLTPYVLQYDFPPLVFPLFFSLRCMQSQPSYVKVTGLALLLFTLSVPIWERPISDGFWIVIGISLLLMLSSISWPRPLSRAHVA